MFTLTSEIGRQLSTTQSNRKYKDKRQTFQGSLYINISIEEKLQLVDNPDARDDAVPRKKPTVFALKNSCQPVQNNGNMGVTMTVQKLQTKMLKVWGSIFIPSILTNLKCEAGRLPQRACYLTAGTGVRTVGSLSGPALQRHHTSV